MRKAAKILIAGTLVAIPLQALWCGAATSQTAPPPPQNRVVIDQVQLGDVMSNNTLNVVTMDTVVINNMAVGNSATVGSVGIDTRVDSKQRLNADVQAATVFNNTGYSGTNIINTSAYGNVGEATVTEGANLSGGWQQKTAAGTLVKGGTRINSENADLGPLTSVSTTAVANSQGFGIEGGGTSSVVLAQRANGTAQASESATFRYTAGEVDMASLAVSNNVTAVGTTGSSQIITSSQKMRGEQTLGYSSVTTANAQTLNNVATATANNFNASNEGGPLEIIAQQVNKGYVRAQADNVADQFGTNNAMAYGVGNSATASESGIELSMDFDQVNRGGVTAVSTVSGGTGYDSSSTSVAMGNAITGSACSTCGGVIDITSRQVNSNTITAGSTTTIGGTARSATSVSTAVGNSATFYSSRPNG